jgi:polyphosphate kinase 2 (PPK2 family)
VLKFFLHISKEEQEKRLLARENDPTKAWKLSLDDWKQRERWDEYSEAYEDAISRCGSPKAPWVLVPADAKWYRNLVVAEHVTAALRPYRKSWLRALEKRGEELREQVREWRRSRKKSAAK